MAWMIQCKILQHNMLGAQPANEDNPPDEGNNDPPMYNFFGFGQPRNGPPNNWQNANELQ